MDAEAMVRGRGAGGASTSAWFRAGALRLRAEGLMAGAGFPMAETRRVMVTDLDADAAGRLAALTPAGGKLERPLRLAAAHELQAGSGAAALHWALSFVAQESTAGKGGGVWHLERDAGVADVVLGTGADRAVVLSAPQLVDAMRAANATVAPGISWASTASFDVRYFDPLVSALAVPLFPLVLAWSVLDPWQLDESVERPVDSTGRSTMALMVWAPPPDGSDRLFESAAQRRAIIKVLATADIAANLRGDRIAGLSVGIRLRNFFEFAAVGREISWNRPVDHGGRTTRAAAGVSVGVHVNTNASPAFAFAFGGEVVGAGGTNPLLEVTLKWGLRLGVGRYGFLTVAPLNLSSIDLSGPGPQGGYRTTMVLSSIEMGGAL
jgi:hypothetical protein